MTESSNVAALTSNNTREAWYETYNHTVIDIVHQVYTKDATYQKLRARITPDMALAVSALTAGCSADPSVTTSP